MNIEQVAREIVEACIVPQFKVEEVAAILAQHVPAPAVVEVEDHDFGAACWVAGVPMCKIDYKAGAKHINETMQLRARAGTSGLIRRPTTTVTTIKTPKECGVSDGLWIVYDAPSTGLPPQNIYARNWDSDWHGAHVTRWCVPFTDIKVERTEVQTPRAWEAGDVPAVGQVFAYRGPSKVGSFVNDGRIPDYTIAEMLNTNEAYALYILREVTP